MAASRRTTNDVLASARRDLQAQLAVVRNEVGRLAAEERALTKALSGLDAVGAASASAGPVGAPRGAATRSPTRKAAARRRRRPRAASKSTTDRVKELRGILSDGPKSRIDLAAALGVSPARVQQLLAELGSSVSSRPDPGQRQGKLWSLKGSGNGASASGKLAAK